MLKSSLLAAVAIAMIGAAANRGEAAGLMLDGGWEKFTFAGVGSSWRDTFSFTVGLGEAALFQVTDAFLAGDRFEVFSGGVSLGLTSTPMAARGMKVTGDSAFADPHWSSGAFLFTEGSYTVTGTAALSPYGSGAAYVRLVSTDPLPSAPLPATAAAVTTPIPLPAAGWLLIGAVGGLAVMRRRGTG